MSDDYANVPRLTPVFSHPPAVPGLVAVLDSLRAGRVWRLRARREPPGLPGGHSGLFDAVYAYQGWFRPAPGPTNKEATR